MVICLERGADLLMPLPLTVCCFSKIQIGFTILVPAYPGSPGQRAVKRVFVCVCFISNRNEFFCIGLTSEFTDLAQNLAIGKGVNKVCYTQTSRLYLRFMSPITSYTEYYIYEIFIFQT